MYTKRLLQQVNELCIQYKQFLEVRFYGHYSHGFDAKWLAYIPAVENLSLDALLEIEHIENLYHLENLKILSFGVFEFSDKDFLKNIKLTGLKEFSLSESRKKNIDLRPLENATSLNKLCVVGHSKNIESINSIQQLKHVILSQISKKVSLEFLNRLENLEELEVILGGRDNVNEVTIPTLKTLRILRVRNFNQISDLSRFPKLECLHIEDQTKLESIDLSGISLKRLLIDNCKNLTELIELESQQELFWVGLSRTKLDLNDLKIFEWPSSLKVISLSGGSNKWNESCKKFLTQKVT
ncbi:hypothetical protein FE810_03675 [Thalassotalea litorea]|uniref:Leucine-rich repeat domain-containing protein n=1 Tax=Thalassotalea litorea TaxID=2020715 RepID=A0A5R9ITG0_9GAMM|nr:hypothetical protein [Thalassotalea litorea]TLU67387.1 hypothetical protein FE810_03675 [Thalassotalea litorea]